MASALKLTLLIAFGKARTTPTGPPVAPVAPRNGRVCKSMMMMPMPDMNPDITEYGVKATKRPMRITPSRICMRPAMMTMVKASARVSAWVVTMTAMATAMGPVGPEI